MACSRHAKRQATESAIGAADESMHKPWLAPSRAPPPEQADADGLLQFEHQDEADRGEDRHAHVRPVDRPRVVKDFERRQVGEQDLQHDDGANPNQKRARQPYAAEIERRAVAEGGR